VITVLPYASSAVNQALPGGEYDGVVRIKVGNTLATGALLYDGRAVLTAAHLFLADSNSSAVTVFVETTAGQQSLSAQRILVHPQYDSANSVNDLAIIWLTAPAPVQAQRYNIYRASDEIGQVFTAVGFGKTGLGSTGYSSVQPTTPVRVKSLNVFDTDAATLKNELDSNVGWQPTNQQLVADFDDGSVAHDALGGLLNLPNLGQGSAEGFIASGDSGGPAFINGLIAGVASYVSSMNTTWVKPDVDSITNSSFGEIAAWQRISSYQQWIDQSLRAQYANAPASPEQVVKVVAEGNAGTSYVYFMLNFTGVRSYDSELLSVEYATRDGTATAGSDYLAVKGKLFLYPNENQAVIPVEVMGDLTSEQDEYFYLDVFNPVGGSFGPDTVQLTAIRTILNDDGIFGTN
jgi:secreted trypsin-like serine protease